MTTQATESTPEELQAARLKELRARNLQREEAVQAEEDAREIQELELVEKLESELGGSRGKTFDVVNTPFGVFGVRKPDARGIAAWDKATGKSTEQLTGILRNYIYPESDAMRFHAVCTEYPGVTSIVAASFLALTGAVRFEAKKK